MFDLYMERSPTVFKAAIMLEECALEYRIKYTSVSHGHQHAADFKKISPNEKIPVLVDFNPADGGESLPVFESGAILIYLAEKTGKFLSKDFRTRLETLQWTFWQSCGLSPMSGQIIHFTRYAPEAMQEYGSLRYKTEVLRIYGVLNARLQDRAFMCGDYSIADIGTFPWILMHDRFDFDLAEYPNVNRWYQTIRERPAVKQAYTRGYAEMGTPPDPSMDLLKSLFGKNAPLLRVPGGNFKPKAPLHDVKT